MNRDRLAKVLASKTQITPVMAEKLIMAFGEIVTDALAKGDKIVYSNFGTFYTVHYPSKVIYHPILGAKKKMVMLPTNVVKWMPSGNIKDMVNSGKEIESATSFGASKKFKETKNDLPPIYPEPVEDKTKEDEPKISFGYSAQADSAVKNEVKKPEEEEAVEIPIRQVAKEPEKVETVDINVTKTDAPEMTETTNESQTTADKAETEDKSGFWDHLFNKESHDKAPQTTEKDALPPINDKDEAKSPSVGIGLFGGAEKADQGPADKITKTEDLPTSKETTSPAQSEEPEEEDAITPFAPTKTTISYIDLSKKTIAKEILQLISEKIAREYKIVPVEDDGQKITVAMADPEDVEAIEIVKKVIGRQISPLLTSESDLNHVLDQYQGLESEVKEAIEDVAEENPPAEEDQKENVNIASSDTAPASRIVSSLLKRAIRDKASDVHIEPYEGEVVVRFRIDGILHKKVTLPKSIQQAVVSRIKIMSELKIDEQRLPQDGRFSINFDSRKVDFRVSTMPIANGEKVVMRILDKVSGVISIDDLGFRKRDLDLVNQYTHKSHGMILVTGPTGSGKTTTLYALIDKIYNEGINIITLEDPIEYQISGINQSQVNAEIDYTFASGLRSILRQDPDVVMIGEIRDRETAEMAVHAALTGHVVLSTLHTNDSAGALPRLVDMQIEPFLLNSSLNLVMGQRLARKICESCKEEVTATPDQIKIVKEELDSLPKSEKDIIGNKYKFFKGKGCKECADTGYKGRIGLYEVLEVDERVKALVTKQTSSNEIKEAASQSGMTTMIQDGIIKAMTGLTTLEEIWRVTKE